MEVRNKKVSAKSRDITSYPFNNKNTGPSRTPCGIHCPPRTHWEAARVLHLWPSNKLNSFRPSDAFMHHQARPSLVQMMARHLFGSKPLSEPMLAYCQLNPWEHISVTFELKIQQFPWKNVDCNIGGILSPLQCANNALAQGYVAVCLKMQFSNKFQWLTFCAFPAKWQFGERYRIPLLTSQHWFR